MIKATNPVTDAQMELDDNLQVGEIITDQESGQMLEVKQIENGVATLEAIEVEEDWGE